MNCPRLHNQLLKFKPYLIQSVVYFRFSVTQRKVLQTPDIEEVKVLRHHYPRAKNLIHQLFKPLAESDEKYGFHVQNVSNLNGRCCKTHIQFSWPQVFTVTGQSTSQEQAEENAYLLACDMFKNIGVISESRNPETSNTGMMVDSVPLLTHLEQLANEYSQPPMFHFVSTCTGLGSSGGGSRWHSELRISPPFNLSTSGSGSSQDGAQQIACLNACVRLKLMGLWSPTHSFNMAKVHRLMKDMLYQHLPPPDFSLFVDASMVGYGALLTPNSLGNHKARWISDTWPEEVKQSVRSSSRNAVGFLECYAAVAAVYTWKHKFVDKDVLVWSDSQQVVDLINRGFRRKKQQRQTNCYKTLGVLQETCGKNNIRLRAQHLSRYDNVAADILSKFDLEKFHEVVPDAHGKPKKTKKLLFFLPFIFKEDNT